MNAYYQEGVNGFTRLVKAVIDLGHIETAIKMWGTSTANLVAVIMNQHMRKDFVKALTPENYRRIAKRLARFVVQTIQPMLTNQPQGMIETTLFEQTIRLDDETGQMFVVTKNPSKAQYTKMLSSDGVDYKGIVTDKDYFVWSAWHAHHHQIANALGLSNNFCCAMITKFGITIDQQYEDMVRNNPNIKYLYGNAGPNLYFG